MEARVRNPQIHGPVIDPTSDLCRKPPNSIQGLSPAASLCVSAGQSRRCETLVIIDLSHCLLQLYSPSRLPPRCYPKGRNMWRHAIPGEHPSSVQQHSKRGDREIELVRWETFVDGRPLLNSERVPRRRGHKEFITHCSSHIR